MPDIRSEAAREAKKARKAERRAILSEALRRSPQAYRDAADFTNECHALKLEADHIIPLTAWYHHRRSNMQCLTKSVNMSKKQQHPLMANDTNDGYIDGWEHPSGVSCLPFLPPKYRESLTPLPTSKKKS